MFALLSTLHLMAQTADSLTTTSKALEQVKTSEEDKVSKEKINMKELVGRYKVYKTANIYNSLKLDTATGTITALQIGVNDNASRMEYIICGALEMDPHKQIVNRYELYPTGNNYNFILVDTIFGDSYQVQWSTKSKECGRWPIW